jgi:hypothetical protein
MPDRARHPSDGGKRCNPRRDGAAPGVRIDSGPRRPLLSLSEVVAIQEQRRALIEQIRRTLRRRPR